MLLNYNHCPLSTESETNLSPLLKHFIPPVFHWWFMIWNKMCSRASDPRPKGEHAIGL